MKQLNLYNKQLLHEAPLTTFTQTPFTPGTFYTTHPLHHTIFTTNSFYTRHPFDQKPFTPGTFYTRHLLQQTVFTTNNFYTKHPLHQAPFTPRTFYTRHLLHQTPFTTNNFNHDCKHDNHDPVGQTGTSWNCCFKRVPCHVNEWIRISPDVKNFFHVDFMALIGLFTTNNFYTKHPLHQAPFTPGTLYLHQTFFLHQTIFTTKQPGGPETIFTKHELHHRFGHLCCEACTEAVHSVALWTRATLQVVCAGFPHDHTSVLTPGRERYLEVFSRNPAVSQKIGKPPKRLSEIYRKFTQTFSFPPNRPTLQPPIVFDSILDL